MRRFYKVFVTGMTTKVYPTPKFFVSLAYLVSPPLNTLKAYLLRYPALTAIHLRLGYPIRKSLASLGVLVSKPLKLAL